MNEKDYRLLTAMCDEILLGPDVRPEVVAIPWLHVLNEHPGNLEKYEGLFHQRSFSYLRLLMRQNAKAVLSRVKNSRRDDSTDEVFSTAPLPARADVLFVSHLINTSDFGRTANDFYFGLLPELLCEEGASVVTVLQNHTELQAGQLTKLAAASGVPKVVLSRTCGRATEREMLCSLRAAGRALRIASNGAQRERRRILRYAAVHATASESLATLRVGKSVSTLVKRLKPKLLVTTLEGHAWERVAFALARAAEPRILCVGYHHTILFPRQHALVRPLLKEYNPDEVFTAGVWTRDQLVEKLRGVKLPIHVIGTHRTSPGVIPLNDNLHRRCLVLPDGLPSECETLFNFALDCAARAPDIEFVFRLHPILSFDRVLRCVPALRRKPANVVLSDLSLEDDFRRCSWTLYRGSSAAVYGLMHGLRPIYVRRFGEMDMDPLYGLDDWKLMLSDPEACVDAMRSDLARLRPMDDQARERAIAFSKSYFPPVDYKSAVDKLREFCK